LALPRFGGDDTARSKELPPQHRTEEASAESQRQSDPTFTNLHLRTLPCISFEHDLSGASHSHGQRQRKSTGARRWARPAITQRNNWIDRSLRILHCESES